MGPSDSLRLQRVQRFFQALANREITQTSSELSLTATYHVPGANPLAGTFRGREEVTRHLRRLFEWLSCSEAVQWVDWMVGANLVSVLVQAHLQEVRSRFDDLLLFVVDVDSTGVSDIRLFPADQARLDRFLAQFAFELPQ